MPSPQELLAALEAQLTPLESTKPCGKFMLFGNSGTGKTVLSIRIAQAITPPDKQILYVDFKEGWTSLLNHDPALRARVTRLPYENYTQVSLVVDAIWNNVGKFANVGTIVIDEHTSMAQDDMEAITRNRAQSDKEKDPDTPTWPDMNTAGLRARRALNSVLDLPINVILVAHERDNKDRRGVVVTTPNYLPKLYAKILEPLHFVGHCTATLQEGGADAGKYVRQVQCHPSKLIVCKSRVGGLGIFETHENLIEKLTSWLSLGGMPESEAAQVSFQDEQEVLGEGIVDEAAILVED